MIPKVVLSYNDFNPRSREGSDLNLSSLRANRKEYFNPRSREGSDWKTHFWALIWLYFNPRSREGSDSGRKEP